MAQAIKHLPNKHKALSSNPSTAKKVGEGGVCRIEQSHSVIFVCQI
jgi:hypothetical protein